MIPSLLIAGICYLEKQQIVVVFGLDSVNGIALWPGSLNITGYSRCPIVIRRYDWVAIVAILTIGLLVLWNGITAHGFWWTDESRHSMHGIFFIDFIRDMPLFNPYDYVQRYFAQYPAIAFNWYLPLFPTFMGTVMAILGKTEISAHLSITLIWLAGILALYAWAVPHLGRTGAFAACLILLSMPVVVLWSRSVMLEAPAVALCMLSLYSFERYLDNPSHQRAIAAGLVIFLMLLTKQTTLFFLVVLIVHALSLRKWRLALYRKDTLWMAFFIAIGLSAIVLHAVMFGPTVALQTQLPSASGAANLWTIDRWILYTKSLIHGMGAAYAIAFAFGAIYTCYAYFKHRDERLILPLIWLISCYIWITYLTGVPGNSERYAIYSAPAIALFIAHTIPFSRRRQFTRHFVAGAIIFLAGWHVVAAIKTSHWHVSGYEEAAHYLSKLPNTGTIFVFAKHDGSIIFHLRNLDIKRERVVLRGDKTLVDMSVHKYFGIKSNASSVHDVKEILDRLAVRWIVVESKDLVGLKEFDLLHALLERPEYKLMRRIPIKSNLPDLKDLEIMIYQNTGLLLPDDGKVTIEYPYLGRSYQYKFQTPNRDLASHHPSP